uniref:G patch domain and KOW motifs-containing protein n=1 Tax=Bactrocera dorsalis TaxID=27457 RepID=A0A034WLE0_BACDO
MVIPLKENTKTSAALASLMKRRAILLGEADELPPSEQTSQINNNENHVNETLEERAARELLASVQSKGNETIDQNLVLPALKADELPLDGAKQSTIDDYDNVPIEQFGKAMLRGMGWTESIQKKGETQADEMLFVRPKGMGLGADKALKKQPLLVAPEKNEVLEIKKQAYVRILGGKHKDMYGQIEGFDDHAGRVIVKMAIGGGKEAFNEFLCQPVSKKEFAQYGKCINTAKYEKYKKMENEHGQIIIKKEGSPKKTLSLKDKIKGEYKNNSDNKHKSENKHGHKGDEISDKNTQIYKYDNDRERFDQHSSSRRQRSDDRQSYHSRGRRSDGYRDSNVRHYELDELRSSSSRRERYDDRRKEREESKRRSRERSSRTEHEKRHPSAGSYSRRQQYTDDTSASSGTDSDSDSAYERKLKKKSSNDKLKQKKKSSKKSKRKQRHRTSDTETSSNSDSEDDEDASRREKNHHKKKTKKSKKPRSRSRSHDRTGKR